MRFSFQQLCGVLPDALVLASSDGTILEVNRAAAQIIGKNTEHLQGIRIQNLAASSGSVEDYLRLCSRTASPTVGMLDWQMNDGTKVTTRCEGHLIQSDSEQAPRLVLLRLSPKESSNSRFVILNDKISQLGREIEAKTAAQTALQQSESRFRFLADFIPQILWTARPDGYIDYFNQRWFDYTGMTYSQTAGEGWHCVVHPDDLSKCLQKWNQAVFCGVPYEAECRLYRRDGGDYRWHLARAVALRDANGKIVKWFGSSTDIHDNKLAQQALLKSEKLAAAGRLAATIAHEINNPLEAVINLLYLAQRGLDPGHPVGEYLVLADQELARVSEIARQTLGFYRDTSSPVSFSVSAVIENAVRLYSRKTHLRHVQVDTGCDPDLTIHAVQGEIRQVLANLISNAIDACPPGGKVRVQAHRTLDWNDSMRPGVRILVADSGAGIDKQALSHIFEPFFSTKKDVGTGLGLWVSREIIRKHGGSIRVRSSRDGQRPGSVFSIFLPLSQTREPCVDAQAAA